MCVSGSLFGHRTAFFYLLLGDFRRWGLGWAWQDEDVKAHRSCGVDADGQSVPLDPQHLVTRWYTTSGNMLVQNIW